MPCVCSYEGTCEYCKMNELIALQEATDMAIVMSLAETTADEQLSLALAYEMVKKDTMPNNTAAEESTISIIDNKVTPKRRRRGYKTYQQINQDASVMRREAYLARRTTS